MFHNQAYGEKKQLEAPRAAAATWWPHTWECFDFEIDLGMPYTA